MYECAYLGTARTVGAVFAQQARQTNKTSFSLLSRRPSWTSQALENDGINCYNTSVFFENRN